MNAGTQRFTRTSPEEGLTIISVMNATAGIARDISTYPPISPASKKVYEKKYKYDRKKH